MTSKAEQTEQRLDRLERIIATGLNINIAEFDTADQAAARKAEQADGDSPDIEKKVT